MDPFAFDQRFARFAAHVDGQAMRRGTELFEQGAVTVRRLSAEQIEGSVTDGRLGVFATRLSDNGSGGYSGKCDCETFFNCHHSYALARAAREQVMARMARPAAEGRSRLAGGAATADPAEAPAERRLGRPLVEEERRLLAAVERLRNRAQAAANLLYPQDLRPFVKDGRLPALPSQEPLREFRRMLPTQDTIDLLQFGDALKCLLEQRGLPAAEALDRLGDSRAPAARFERSKQAAGVGGAGEALRLRYSLRLEPAEEAGWYRASAEASIAGSERYTLAEIQRLVEAKGQPVRLEGKGWRQIERSTIDASESVFTALGLDPFRGNQQRIHATQVEALAPEELVDAPVWREIQERKREFEALPEPELPDFLRSALRPYQQDGFRFLCRLTQYGFGGILADDMGLGKTVQALAWLEWLYERGGKRLRALIVCPKSVVDNWLQEPARFGCRVAPFLFQPGAERSPQYRQANLVVANYAQLRLNAERFLAEEWDAAVLDEGQNIKSPDSQIAKTAHKLRAAQRIILSGTPVENRLLDLWSLMRFVLPRLLGPRAAFLANYQSSRGPEALYALRARVRPFILRRLKQQVAAELPERIEKVLRCELEGEQARLYGEELGRARGVLRDLEAGSSASAGSGRLGILNRLLRLRQICCDPALIAPTVAANERSAKMQALLDLLEPMVEEGHKALVFSQFVSMLKRIARELDEAGIAYQMITGQTQDRGEQARRFQSDDGAPIFLLSLKAAGSGLNLTAASYVILVDPWWNPAVEAQAIDRAHRIGQGRQVIAYRLIAKDTVEEKIRELQSRKAELAAAVVDESATGGEGLSLEMIRTALG